MTVFLFLSFKVWEIIGHGDKNTISLTKNKNIQTLLKLEKMWKNFSAVKTDAEIQTQIVLALVSWLNLGTGEKHPYVLYYQSLQLVKKKQK